MGQRPNRPKTKVVSDPKEYFDLLTSAGMEVTNANIINDEIMEIFFVMKDPLVEASDRTNVVLAAFTTVQARIEVYKVVHALGRRVCYYDTDNIIYTVKEGEWKPPLGDHLGELTNELDENDWIVVSAGPKNYAHKTHQGKTCRKVRASEKVNFESMVDLVEKQDGRVPERLQTNAGKEFLNRVSAVFDIEGRAPFCHLQRNQSANCREV